MKGLMVFALAVLLLLPLSAVACDGNQGFGFAAPMYQTFAVQAVPVYQQQVFAAPVYGHSFGNVFAVRNHGGGFNRGFGRGFGGQQVIVQNRGFGNVFNRGFNRGNGGGGNGAVIINNRRGLFGGNRQQIIVR